MVSTPGSEWLSLLGYYTMFHNYAVLLFFVFLITISLLCQDFYLLRCLKRICIVSWFGFGNCLIRSLTAATRCLGSCSKKKIVSRTETEKQCHILEPVIWWYTVTSGGHIYNFWSKTIKNKTKHHQSGDLNRGFSTSRKKKGV